MMGHGNDMKTAAIKAASSNVISPPPRNRFYPYRSYVVVCIRTDEDILEVGVRG